MRDVNEKTLTDAVLATIGDEADPRFREIITALVRHLHGFAKEVELTKEEWGAAIAFLSRTGWKTTEKRNEFILLSDILGLSTLTDMMSSRGDDGATDVSVLGPFYIADAPMIENGGDLIGANDGQATLVRGSVSSVSGEPIPGAMLDIWQNADNGLYSNEDPNQADDNLRARLHAGDDGRYSFTTIRPRAYTVPDDGPGGEILGAMGRHPWRPAHIHFKVTAPGFSDLVTELYPDDDDYIDEDAVFGVRESLVVNFQQVQSEEEAGRHGLAAPFLLVEYDFKLRVA